MRSLRNWGARSVVAAVLLLSPAFALLMVIATEVLADLLMEMGFPVFLDLMATGALGWALFRSRPDLALHSSLEEVSGSPAVPAPLG
jgi:hypothetical protein